MKRYTSIIILCVLVCLVVVNSAFAMTYEEIIEAARNSEGTYEIGGPLTKEDFIVYTTDFDWDKYDYDMLIYLKDQNYKWSRWYPNSAENLEIEKHEEIDLMYTHRGISVDDRNFDGHEVDPSLYSKETVLARYGVGLSGVFDPQKDIVYKGVKKQYRPTMDSSKTWLMYNYKDIAQIRFYFDTEDNISTVVWYNGIKETADKETTRTIQEYLNENGYDCGTPDGIAGKKTKEALTRFQEDHDLFPSGYIDDVLMKYLDKQNVNI